MGSRFRFSRSLASPTKPISVSISSRQLLALVHAPHVFFFFLLVFRYCLSTVHTARWSSPRQLAAWLMNKLTPDTPPFFRSLSCPETISSNHYLILKYFVGERSSLFRVDIKLTLLSISLIPIGGNSSKMPMVIDFLLTTAPNQLASGLRSRTIDTAHLKILP